MNETTVIAAIAAALGAVSVKVVELFTKRGSDQQRDETDFRHVLRDQVKALWTENAQLRQEIEEIRKEYHELQAEHSDLKAKYAELFLLLQRHVEPGT